MFKKKSKTNKKILKAIKKVFDKSNEFIGEGTHIVAKVCFEDIADAVEKELFKKPIRSEGKFYIEWK